MKKIVVLLAYAFLCCALKAAQLPVTLGSTTSFAVLGASTVTNTGATAVTGDLGLSPGTAITGFPPGIVIGTIHDTDTVAAQAQIDLTAAYLDAAGRTIPAGLSADIGGQTLTPGLYSIATTLGITGTVTLDGQGNPSSVFIFQVGTALTTASGSQVRLINGAQAANVFWQVGSSATLGTTSIFNGTILAQVSITLTTGAALNGRALARTGAVTMDTNSIVDPGPPVTGGVPPALTVACPSPAAQIGAAYNSAVLASGGTPPYTYSITGALPAGLTLAPSTGRITGTPTGPGTAFFSVNALDSAALTAANACSIAATSTPATPAPSSLILVLLGLAATILFVARKRAA